MMLYGTHTFSLSPSELAEATGEKPASITRLTDRLAERGLLERLHDDTDRRYLVLKPTTAGVDLLEGLLRHRWKSLSRQLGQFIAGEQSQLERLPRKLVADLADELLAIE